MNPVGFLILIFLGLKEIRSEFASEELQAKFAKGSCQFTLELIKTVSKESEGNVALSPSSISVLLAILQQGANETTAEQLEKLLHLSAEESKIGYGQVINSLEKESENVTLEWGNRAFISSGFELEESFLEKIEDSFNATFEKLNFKELSAEDAAVKINSWVKEATRNNIQNLVDPSLITSEMDLIMVNAIFFKSIWDSPFQKYKTRTDKFHVSQDKVVEVPFMRQAGRFLAGEDSELGIKWVELPFKDYNFSTIFILPVKSKELNQVMEKISGADLKHIINSDSMRRVKLVIPKFKISKKLSLADTLKKLGLTDVFSPKSDLSGIIKNEENLHLSEIVHQAEVEIDEDGSVAAAATFEIAQTLSFEWFTDELYFKADRPFLFFIVDKVNEVPLFAGQIVDPTPSTSQ